MLNYVFIVLVKFFVMTSSNFIEPNEVTDYYEVFQYLDDEFIIYNDPFTWEKANEFCVYSLNGTLAYFENQTVIDFVAEYLSQTDMSLNTLWVNMKKTMSNEWVSVNDTPVETKTFDCSYHVSPNLCPNCKESRDCGAIVRMYHSDYCFVKLQCDARRKFICRRSVTLVRKESITEWIKIENKLFKIYYNRLTYNDAMEACPLHDIDAKLAVIENFNEANILARYMLIGRPSKERTWIGARWTYRNYEFEEEGIVLSNVTDPNTNYPPWLDGAITKAFGCVLLDRHLGITNFVVQSCRNHSKQAYICYKYYEKPSVVDVCSVGNYDWRIYYIRQDWFQATATCSVSSPTGRLPIIDNRENLRDIIHVMETGQFDLLYHVWLGAYYQNGIWIWTYTNNVLYQNSTDGFPPWVVNMTHEAFIEKYNLCLNLDREDSLESIFYGTNCYYPQYFLCQYDKNTICFNKTTTTATSISTTPTTISTTPTTISTTPTTISTTPTTISTTPTTISTTPTTISTTPTTTITPTTPKTTTTTPTTSNTTPTTSNTTPTTSTTTTTITTLATPIPTISTTNTMFHRPETIRTTRRSMSKETLDFASRSNATDWIRKNYTNCTTTAYGKSTTQTVQLDRKFGFIKLFSTIATNRPLEGLDNNMKNDKAKAKIEIVPNLHTTSTKSPFRILEKSVENKNDFRKNDNVKTVTVFMPVLHTTGSKWPLGKLKKKKDNYEDYIILN